jgi:hypothetical protein
MTKPISSDPLKDEPTGRFRTITNWKDDEDPPQESVPRSILEDRLPQTVKRASPPPDPPRRLPAKRASRVNPPEEAVAGRKSRRERYTHAFWNVTSWMALLVDSILIAVVIILLIYVRQLNLELKELKSLTTMPLETVSGLYRNFELMEKAHIVTQIPVSTTVPVKLDVCIKTGTMVVINQDVTIPGARVNVQTEGLNISNARTTIVLPANTGLPVNLDLCVPVETTIPVSLNVNVDILLANTDLNAPFIGLQKVIAPLYCLLDPKALTDHNTLVCDEVPKK